MSTEALRTFLPMPYPQPDRDYEVNFESHELTALCPVMGQPDCTTHTFKYIQGPSIVELYPKDVAIQNLKDFVEVIKPRKHQVVRKLNVRGGMYTTVCKSMHII